MKRFVRERGLAAYKVPDRVVFVDAFPQTGVGKISKKDLRADAARTTAPAPTDTPATPVTGASHATPTDAPA